MGSRQAGHLRAQPAHRPQIPRSYLSLQGAVLAERQRRSLSDDVQYLTDRQLEQLVEQTPCNDINDYEDLQSGGWRRGAGSQRGGARIVHRSARVCKGPQMRCGY